MNYNEFLKTKKRKFEPVGFDVEKESLNNSIFEWQKDMVKWALKKGRAALFWDCGLGKTISQLSWAQKVHERTNKPVIVVAPLAVAEQTRQEGAKFGIECAVVREQKNVINGINITNYEILEHFEPHTFSGVVLDESSILKAFDGKTKKLIIDFFDNTPYKLSCTATPSPNDYMELGNQAEFLGVMSRTEMLSEFFIHDGGSTQHWRLKGHAEDKFWEWISSWAMVLSNPSEIGYDGSDFILPKLNINQITVENDKESSDGNQLMLFANEAQTLNDRREARRGSLKQRCEAAEKLIELDPDTQWLFWVDLNTEADELKRLMPEAVEVRGSDSPEYKSDMLTAFSNGKIKILISKPSIAGYGLNWQCCHNMAFVGLSDSYEMLYQAMRRCWRFGQKHEVNVYIVASELEGAVKQNIERKEKQNMNMHSKMVKYTRKAIEEEAKSYERVTIEYNPTIEMILPKWCFEEKEIEKQWQKK